MLATLKKKLGALSEKQRKQETVAADAWSAMVETIATSPDDAKLTARQDAEIERTLAETGRSPDDFEAAVVVKRQRLAAAAVLAGAPVREQEIRDLEAEQAKAVKAHNEFIRESNRKERERLERLDLARLSLSNETSAANRLLLETASPAITQQVTQITAKLGKLREALETAKDQVNHWFANVQKCERAIADKLNDPGLPGQLESCRQHLAVRNHVLTRINGEMEKLIRKRDELIRQKLAP
jgi:hypothetical protein